MFSYLLDYLGVLVIGELVNDLYLGFTTKLFTIASIRNIVLIYGLYKGYILNKINKIKNKVNSGVKVVDNKVVVTYFYNNRVCNAELYLHKFNDKCIKYINYINDDDTFERDINVIIYNNNIINSSVKNVYYTPRMLGYKEVIVYYLNEEFNEENKKYVENEIIN